MDTAKRYKHDACVKLLEVRRFDFPSPLHLLTGLTD
jgi:hypothetical protein